MVRFTVSRKTRCTSSQVLEHDDAEIEILEHYPCANVHEARARERYWIERTPCVNKNLPGGHSREEYRERSRQKRAREEPREEEEPQPLPVATANTSVRHAPPLIDFFPVSPEEEEEEDPHIKRLRIAQQKLGRPQPTRQRPLMTFEQMKQLRSEFTDDMK